MKLTRGDLIYYLLKPPVKLYLKLKFNIQVENNPLEKLDEPYLLLGHHVTSFDPIISNAYSNRLIRYVSGDANLDNSLKRLLLGLLESIPISKNTSDIKTIQLIRKELKMGHPVGLYPEGGRNWDGVTDTIIPSTAKLIKLMKVPVYAISYKGGFLSKPRWASFSRKGKVVLNVQKILDKDLIQEMSSEEIHELLVDKLNYNEFQWQRSNRVIFKGKNLAEDIQRLLYVCADCQAVNSIRSEGNKFFCTDCGKEYYINQYGEIEGSESFTETVSWNRWQRNLLPDIMKKGFSFSNPDISMEKISVKGEERSKQFVHLKFSRDNLVFEYGDKRAEVINYKDITGISITFLDVVEFFVDKTKYRLVFNPRKHMSVKLFYDLLKLMEEEVKNEFRLECCH